MTGPRVLLVDDEPMLRLVLRNHMEPLGFEVAEADSVEHAKEVFRRFAPDVAVLDYLLPDGNAMDLLSALRSIDPEVPLVLLTGHGSIDLAVRAMKAGAEYLLTKPVELPALETVLLRALEGQLTRRGNGAPREERRTFDILLGKSPAIVELGREVEIAVRSEGPILLFGETGTGKGVLASWLHRHGPRRQKPLVDLNCAGLRPEFLESELFGHARGAYTGAVAEKKGLLEMADQGTLFLDEIGDLGLTVQPKLLKALEEKRFRRMGDVTSRRIDMLLISATHHDLVKETRTGSFRSDLYFRISTFPLRLPSLRERQEDLPLIATQMALLLCQELGHPEAALSREALAAIVDYPWPGNLRELRNVLERALLRAAGTELRPEDLRLEPPGEASGAGSSTLEEHEHRQIEKVLREEQGRVASAARRLGISRSALYQKIRDGRIDLSRFHL
ncbi:MAG TPA: sigma-54 dependent transcriptional regulator [Thermoanaerobaculia bacterium]|nr:sigma-54 dependent transcriptional regulator [Thermoanaerobaculia bacterium]